MATSWPLLLFLLGTSRAQRDLFRKPFEKYAVGTPIFRAQPLPNSHVRKTFDFGTLSR